MVARHSIMRWLEHITITKYHGGAYVFNKIIFILFYLLQTVIIINLQIHKSHEIFLHFHVGVYQSLLYLVQK